MTNREIKREVYRMYPTTEEELGCSRLRQVMEEKRKLLRQRLEKDEEAKKEKASIF
jgi:hypothetical protein